MRIELVGMLRANPVDKVAHVGPDRGRVDLVRPELRAYNGSVTDRRTKHADTDGFGDLLPKLALAKVQARRVGVPQ